MIPPDPGAGRLLEPVIRRYYEKRFARDFSSVQIHTGAQAAASAGAMDADAYTLGSHIVFARGQYAPETRVGRALIAHELAHVVQQQSGGATTGAPETPSLERAANRAAEGERLGGGPLAVEGSAPPGVARQPISLTASADPSSLSAVELEHEVGEIHRWLLAHPESSPERELLLSVLPRLESHMQTRLPPFFGKPVAPEAFRGILPFHVARTVPYSDRVSVDMIIRRSPYIIVPQLVVAADGPESIAYYIANRQEPGLIGPTGWNEWLIGPDSIEKFLAEIAAYAAVGAYMYRNGPPSEAQAASERWLWGTGSSGEALGAAVRDPAWWVQMIAPLAGGARPVPAGAGSGPGLLPGARAVTGGVASEAAAAAPRAPFVPRVIQGGGMPRSVASRGAVPASSLEGNAVRSLQPLPEAPPAASPVLRPVPNIEPMPTPVPATPPVGPSVPGMIGSVAAGGLLRPAAAPESSPSPGLQPSPAPDEAQRRRTCPAASIPIVWPFPIWTVLGHGDRGALSGTYDRPPQRTVTRVTPSARNRTIVGEYVKENWPVLHRYYENGTQGAIHHKWPLYLGGPDSKSNFVFLTFEEHSAWHALIVSQTIGPKGTVYCIVN